MAENFSELSTEELIKKKKIMNFAIGLLAGALITLFITAIYQTTNKKFTPLLIIPFALLPLLVVTYSQVRYINKELKSRNPK